MYKYLFFLGTLLVCPTVNAQTNPPTSITDDIYVRLYQVRLKRAQIAQDIAKKDAWYDGNIRNRADQMFQESLITRAMVEVRRREHEVSILTEAALAAETREAGAMLQIAIDRVTIGLEPPICLELR